MPRSTQSREAGIIAYFKTTDLAIAAVVFSLCKEALGERQAKSEAAKKVAAKAAAPKPTVLTAPLGARPAAKKSHKKKGAGKKAKPARTSTRPPTAAEIEASVASDGAVIE